MVDETILIANMMCQMFPEKKFLRENWKRENCLIVSCDFTAEGLSKYFAAKMYEAGVRKTEISGIISNVQMGTSIRWEIV